MPASVSRESANAVVGSSAWRVVDQQVALRDSAVSTTSTPPVAERAMPLLGSPSSRTLPNLIGSPCTSGMIASALVSGFLIASNAPSLKIGQFW